MKNYLLSFKPAVGPYGSHDPSAALFADGALEFAVEEERYTRDKHAGGTFPREAIKGCLDHADITLGDVNKIILPYDPELRRRTFLTDIKNQQGAYDNRIKTGWNIILEIKNHVRDRFFADEIVINRLQDIGSPVPDIEHRSHHRCHAASAFYPTEFDESIVLTIDGMGEYDSTVVWYGDKTGLERVRTYEYPNSLGHFFGVVTEYLGYNALNGEGKIMGLAPYGTQNREIKSKLETVADFGVDYDVTGLVGGANSMDTTALERLFGPPKDPDNEFTDFHKDLAYTAQSLLECTVQAIAETYTTKYDSSNLALAGGVALNCKMNKALMEMNCIDEIFIQPVAHDGGLALGAGWLESQPDEIAEMTDVYLGPAQSSHEIEKQLQQNKLQYEKIENIERYIAEQLADGQLVGWVQGRLELGPRALGNRSILADPRTIESRDRVNKYVKHREEWRPFAPSMLEDAAEEYLANAEPSPYMIKTFDTDSAKRDEIQAVIHPADSTTRPQTVSEAQNERYYRLISEFKEITGVPVLLNTSFNDHGEPIVNTATEAVRDFYQMGLDILAIDNFVIKKPARRTSDRKPDKSDTNRN